MGLGLRRNPEPVNARKLRPHRNASVVATTLESGSVALEAPEAPNNWRLAFFRRRSRFELDAVGAFVWELCDGRHSVEQITQKLASAFKMHRLEAETALLAYLKTLSQRGLVEIAPPRAKGR